MGFNYSPPPTVFAPKGLIVGGTISALGDSISAPGSNFPAATSLAQGPAYRGLADVPVWTASTAYTVGNLVLKGGLLYHCTAAGTSGATGPTGQGGSTDGSVSWAFMPFIQNRSQQSYLQWVEAFTLGALKWNMAQGYAGIAGSMVRALIAVPGSGYAQGDLATWANGAKGYLNVTGGVPTSVTITNPGYATTTGFGAPTITTAGGVGCTISNVSQVAGTFGVPGCTTADMVARLPDCSASTVDIFVVLGGTNDLGAGMSFAAITGNLKTCYETLVGAGKRVIAVPILPRATGSETSAQLAMLHRVNRWIRAYARREAWANPSQVIVGLADPTRHFTDGTSATAKPIGAAVGGNGAMTLDGLHPSPRGAQYLALAIIAAAQNMGIGTSPSAYPRAASQADGYHPTLNPGGNYLEAQPWTGSTAVTVGETRSNAGENYCCQVAGTTAASGGPSFIGGTGVDGSVTWKWSSYAGRSVFAAGAQGVPASSGGYTNSGVTDKAWPLYHTANGGCTGTVSGAIEAPWSDGQVGQRQSLSFSLSGGTNVEQWQLYVMNFAFAANDYANQGILQADLGVTPFVFEVELELTGASNLTQLSTLVQDNQSNYAFRYETSFGAYSGTGASATLMKSTGDMLPYPNGGRMVLRSDPFVLPGAPFSINTLFAGVTIGFDASTSAASATVKVNHAALRRSGVA